MLAVAAATWASWQLAQERWQREVEAAVQKPQQFIVHWLELQRQLARGVVLRSKGMGWNDAMTFAIDAAAVSTDTDGDIALPMAAARLDAQGRWTLTGTHALPTNVWPALREAMGPMAWQERLLPPLDDGRVVLAMPFASDQTLLLLMDLPDLVRQLRSIDWPLGVNLGMRFAPTGADAAVVVIADNTEATSGYQFVRTEPSPWGSWAYHWHADRNAVGGANLGLTWSIASLGALAVLALSAFTWQLGLRYERQRELNAVLDQRVEARTAELRHSNEQLARTLHQLAESEKLGALGRLVSGVAHQLNTPLGVITTGLSTAQEALQGLHEHLRAGTLKRSAAEQALGTSLACLDLVARNAERATSLTEHFKQMTGPTSQLARSRFSLPELIRRRADTVREALSRGGHTLELKLDEPLALDSHPLALEQVLDHLIQNAIVHGLADASPGQLTLSAVAIKTGVRVSVADTGVGMPPATRARYFDPFFTSKLEKGHSGLGGYAIYNTVVGLLGGSVHLESEPGRGTTVHLDLPLQAGPVTPSSAPDAA